MAYDLEEQEQLAELKAWWNKYGNLHRKVKAGAVSDQVWAFWDFLPTACELAGVPAPKELSFFTASATTPAHTVIFIAKVPKVLRGYVRASTREFGPQSERIADKM